MTFGSLLFLCVFMPVSVLLYHLIPGRFRAVLLLLFSLLFYAWGSPRNLALLLLIIVLNYFAGLGIESLRQAKKPAAARNFLIAAAACDIAVLAFYKYVAGSLPIGLSFYIFSVLSCLFDIFREKAPAEKNPLHMALYVAYFPKVTSGPIVRYAEFHNQLEKLPSLRSDPGPGLVTFLTGLFKKVLIADTLGRVFAGITAMPAISGATAWLGMIFYSLQLYFDFSGYSDMAIGLSSMLGFQFSKNFDYPYLSLNISEFWRKWHISLGAWFREYVYIPLGGNRCSPLLQARNLLAVWVLTGIWHGSTLNFLVWGLYHGAFVLLERFVLKKGPEVFPKFLRILVTDLIVFFGWVFFFSPSLGAAMAYFGKMFCMDGLGFWDGTASFLLRQNLLLLAAAVVLCGPAVKNLHDRLAYREGGNFRILSVVLFVLGVILCLAQLVSATYTSFLYFQF